MTTVDPVTLEVLKNHTRAAAESMAFTLYRTAHSTFVKETEDFTVGLTTPGGETFASPIDLGATWFVALNYGNVIRAFDDYEEGDICITNDPYSGFVCTHPPDMHIWKPIFHDGQLMCFAVGHIHNTDVGGAVPASLSRTLTEVHQEGIRLPPSKLMSGGKLNQQLLDILNINVRVPEQNWGDLKAQIAGVNTGERKVHEMIAKFGPGVFAQGIDDLLDYAEAQVREIVRGIPDGEYSFADYMDEDAVDGWPCRLCLKVIIKDGRVILDYSGSDPQVNSSLNMPTGGDPRHVLALVGLVYVLYSLDPTLYLNAGIARVVHCILPQGSIVNPVFPAAIGMRSLTCGRVQDLTIGAFSQALPDLMPAASGSGGPIMNVNTTEARTGRRVMAAINPITGGGGGRALGDGTNGSGANAGFLKNTPVEITESEVPIRVLSYGLARDSGGAGYHRGGLGTEMTIRSLAPMTRVTARNKDRTRFAGWGIEGGQAGATSRFILNPGSDTEKNLGNTDILDMAPNEVLYVSSGGAGGWGDPYRRDAEVVLLDVARGFVSEKMARDAYGVVIKQGKIDDDATRKLRKQHGEEPSAGDPTPFYNLGRERINHEKIWTKQNYQALLDYLEEVPVHWRFFVKQRVFAAIDALTADELQGDGSEVRNAIANLIAEIPQLKTKAAK